MPESMTVEDARHALHHVGDPAGHQPGSFTEALITAIVRADAVNRALLWRSYPGLMQALQLARTESGRRALVDHCGATR